jgi:uncharacterized metal-binding protein
LVTDILTAPLYAGLETLIAVELAKEGKGKLFCLAGIGGHVSGIVESTKAAKQLVVIDGCPVKCALKTLEHAGFKSDIQVVVTEQGIEKTAGPAFKAEDCKTVVNKVREALGA